MEAPFPGSLLAGSRLVIIRHGEALCNAEEFIGGKLGCRGLTDLGRRQSELLAERLLRSGELSEAAGFFASELPRATETAAIVGQALPRLSLHLDAALSEREPGEADGLTWEEFSLRYGRSSTPGDHPDEPLSPGGESWIAFVDRAAAALLRLVEAHPGELAVVVSHGGVIDASLIRFLGLPEHGTGVRLHAENTSLTEWQYTGRRWRLVRYNDAAHLGPLVRATPPAWVEREV